MGATTEERILCKAKTLESKYNGIGDTECNIRKRQIDNTVKVRRHNFFRNKKTAP